MSTFPSVLTTYTNPIATNRLNAPSHSGIETAQNGGLEQVEAVIGVEGASSVVGSFQYLIKSPASDGGGHVQVANKGGTGQTTYTKGDMLVATSSSVLTKLAVGSDTQMLVADSTTQAGIKWSPAGATKVSTFPGSILTSFRDVASSVVVWSGSVAGGTLGTSGALKFSGIIKRYLNANDVITVGFKYGNNVVASLVTTSASSSTFSAKVDGTLIADGATGTQVGWMQIQYSSVFTIAAQTISTGSSSVNSAADQNLDVFLNWAGAGGSGASILTGPGIIEKIT